MGEIRECFLHGLYTTDECLECLPDPKPVTAEVLASFIYNAASNYQMQMVLPNKDDWDKFIAAAILEKYRAERREG